jgi:hypothetical protein
VLTNYTNAVEKRRPRFTGLAIGRFRSHAGPWQRRFRTFQDVSDLASGLPASDLNIVALLIASRSLFESEELG